jgi:hypothetical protein
MRGDYVLIGKIGRIRDKEDVDEICLQYRYENAL